MESNLAHLLECVVSPAAPRFIEKTLPHVRVLLDGRKIDGGGIGVYIKNLIGGLSTLENVALTVLVHPDKVELARRAGALQTIEDTAKLYSIDELLFLRGRIDFSGYDIFHSPHYTLPYRIPIPTVVTVHDIIHITHPEKFYYPIVAKRLIRSALKRADKIITVSEATRRGLEMLAPRAVKKISVIPNAVDPFFLLETSMLESVPEESERGDYIVATYSNAKPHKGLTDLLRAFESAKARAGELFADDPLRSRLETLKLVLVGTGTESMKNSELPPGVYAAGAVSIRELQRLYARALALVVSSKVEGFCLPVIEAQACATPVIARPIPAVLELMTTNDFVCEDLSIESLAKGIYRFFERRIRNPEYLEYGVPLGHMRRFCREEVSRSVVETYLSTVAEAKR